MDLTITRALAELKLLDKRINKQIGDLQPVKALSKKDKNFNENEFAKASVNQLQSVNDLINRRDCIKRAVILQNSRTQVKLGEKQLTVAEVIDLRKSITYRKSLLNKLKQSRDAAKTTVELNNADMEDNLQNLLIASFGKSAQTHASDIDNISKPFREVNQSKVIDAINCDLEIKKLEEYIEECEREADFVLSESNALTTIKI